MAYSWLGLWIVNTIFGMARNMVAPPQIPRSMGLSMSVALAGGGGKIVLFCQRKDARGA
jgi:hypothetical protein